MTKEREHRTGTQFVESGFWLRGFPRFRVLGGVGCLACGRFRSAGIYKVSVDAVKMGRS